MSDSEGEPYDEDFEEVSDEEARLNRSLTLPAAEEVHDEALELSAAAASAAPAPAASAAAAPRLPTAPTTPASSAAAAAPAAGRRPRPGASGGLRTEAVEMRGSLDGASTPLERAGSTGSSVGRRVVRGKVSVGAGDEYPAPPGTGDSSGGGGSRGTSGATTSASSKPLWLQDTRPARGSGAPSSAAGGLGDDDAYGLGGGYSGGRPSRSRGGSDAPGGGGVGGGRSRRHGPAEDFAALFARDSDEVAAAADSDRQVKRLQGEIQRLTQRLKEAELFSSQDDGLPVFALDDVDIGLQIAQGGFAVVHDATWHGTHCALKKIFDPVITEELRSEFENEVRMLRRLRHPNVVTLMAVCRKPPALSILTELVTGGSLFQLLHSPPGAAANAYGGAETPEAEPSVMLPVMREAASALAYLHAMEVVHRDVKSQNVLLTAGRRPSAKLCDFGLARMRSELCTGTMQWAGTPAYMAPELFAKRRYAEGVDVFAYGVMMWEVVSTELPHANLDPVDIAHRVQTKDGAGLPVTHSWPKSLKNFLRSAMAVSAENRPSMDAAVREVEKIIMDYPPPD
eukprot:TRINITY_DN20095_c0_g1_i1.p2 TRINITY_DN20095_c0_g1~~TRINITY_DN20095_c0_g1_i1.p2  ORF type:complete len:568 (-),score=154.26 TRINITY_DN20095_c0_g1_i1:79-1782(-)